MGEDGVYADIELLCNLFVDFSCGDEPQHFYFALRERISNGFLFFMVSCEEGVDGVEDIALVVVDAQCLEIIVGVVVVSEHHSFCLAGKEEPEICDEYCWVHKEKVRLFCGGESGNIVLIGDISADAKRRLKDTP